MQDSLLDLIGSILKWKKQIIRTCLGVGLVTAVASLLFLSNYYQSTTVFLAASPKLAQPGYIFGRTSTEMEIYGDDFDVDRIITISQSGEVINYLIEKFDLYKHYDIDRNAKRAAYKVRLHFSKLYEVKKNKNEAIELSVEDKDPQFAAQIANAAREKIDEIGQRLIKDSHMSLIKTYENNLLDFDRKISTLSDSLEKKQKRYGIYNPESQSEIYSQLIANAEARLAGERAKLQMYNSMTGISTDSIRNAKVQISSQEQQLNTINARLSLFNEGMSEVQVMKDELTELAEKRSTTIFLFNQLQSAYNSGVSSIHLVEEGEIPLIKSRPKRSILVIGAVFVAFVFMLLVSIVVENYRSIDWKSVSGRN